MIKVVKRTQMSAGKRALLQLLSIVLALVLTGLLLLLLKYNSIAVYREMFYGALGSLYRVQQTINKMIPLLIMGLGLSVCFRSQFMNIGSEGQFYMGAIGATFAIRLIGDRLGALTLPTMMLFSFILGGLWCLLPALLKRYYGVSETLVTLLLNYIAIRIVFVLQYSAWKDPEAYGFPKIAIIRLPLYCLKYLEFISDGLLLLFWWQLFIFYFSNQSSVMKWQSWETIC